MFDVKNIEFNIMLIGFMGTGKSYVSNYLKDTYEMEEVDMDQLIIQREGMPIADIFEKKGEEYFRDCESKLLIELQNRHKTVISCGGGVVLRAENIAQMKKNGRIVLLTASPATVLERVKDGTDRPILNQNMNVTFIEELMEKRRKKYEMAADIKVNTDHKSVEIIAEEIIVKLEENANK